MTDETSGPCDDAAARVSLRTRLWATGTKLKETFSEAEPWSIEQVHFNENARAAARRALFFTRLVEPDHSVEELQHALTRALEQVDSINPPPKPGDGADAVAEGSSSGSNAGTAGRDLTGSSRKYTGAYETFDQLEMRFDKLKGCLRHLLGEARKRPNGEQSTTSAYQLVQPLDRALCAYLEQSVPKNFAVQLVYVRVPGLLAVIRQHAGFLLTFIVAFFLAFRVEAIWSLLRNLPWYWIIGIALTTLLPVVIDVGVGRWLRIKKNKTPWWDRGGLAFLSMSPATLQPQSWIPHQFDKDEGGRIYRGLVGKFAVYLACWIGIGFIYWIFETARDGDGVGLTTYMIVVTIELVVLVGAAVDFVDLHSQAPFRRWILWGVAALALAVGLSDRTPVVIAAVFAWLGITWWIARQVDYRQIVPALVTLTFVVVAGVSVTAFHRSNDIWEFVSPAVDASTATVEWPYTGNLPVVVMAASGGGSRSAIYTTLTLDSLAANTKLDSVLNNLHAISSVSGGSLANAAYVASRLSANSPKVPTCAESLTTRVGGDFLRPTLLGLFFRGRARGIERAWEACPVGLGSATIDDVGQAWREAQGTNPPFPLPIFNSVTLDRHAVAISPIGKGGFLQGAVDGSARGDENAYELVRRLGQPTWVYYRSGIYSHQDLVGSYDPPLASAVRASANFPFGFPLVEVRTTAKLWYGPRENARTDDPKIVRMTDGGALSNSGMWSLFPLLLNHKDVLRQRGTLLIVVDASGMPPYRPRNRQLRLIETILDKNPKGEFLHREMLERLETTLGPCFATVQITLQPTDSTNVYTTWTLDDTKKTMLTEIFASNWRQAAPRIGDAWTDLQECVAGDSLAIDRLVEDDNASGGPRWPIS